MWRKSGVGFLTFAAVSFLGTAAWAGGSLKDAPVDEGYVWNGLYVGVGIGAGSFDNDVKVDASKQEKLERRFCQHYQGYCSEWSNWYKVYDFEKSASALFADDEWNVFGTVQIGYDRLVGKRFLIGVFADFDFYSDSEHSFSKDLYDGKWKVASVDGRVELDNVWSVGGRLGFLLTPRILVYGVAGYTQAKLDGSVDVDFKFGPTLKLAAPDELEGYFVGGGTELKLHKNLSLKVEYRWTHLDGDSASAAYNPDPYVWGCGCTQYKLTKAYEASADFDADIQSVRAVLVMKLGDHERHVEPLK